MTFSPQSFPSQPTIFHQVDFNVDMDLQDFFSSLHPPLWLLCCGLPGPLIACKKLPLQISHLSAGSTTRLWWMKLEGKQRKRKGRSHTATGILLAFFLFFFFKVAFKSGRASFLAKIAGTFVPSCLSHFTQCQQEGWCINLDTGMGGGAIWELCGC